MPDSSEVDKEDITYCCPITIFYSTSLHTIIIRSPRLLKSLSPHQGYPNNGPISYVLTAHTNYSRLIEKNAKLKDMIGNGIVSSYPFDFKHEYMTYSPYHKGPGKYI